MSDSNHAWITGPKPGTYHAQHDWNENEPLSTTVITAVAEARNEDPREMDPLCERFDPDALDGLFSPTGSGEPLSGGHFSFTYKGYNVFVGSDGHVAVHPPEEPTSR